MASGGQTPLPPSTHPPPSSWAQVASSGNRSYESSPLHNPQLLDKLKNSSTSFVKLDADSLSRAHQKFQHALYGKFFGKPSPFDQVRKYLMAKWAMVRDLQISDLPNGFLLIRCAVFEDMQKLLTEGPWTLNGLTLQLAPWRPFFELTFVKLSTAAVWVQLHNLPVELWDGESLDNITSHLGNLLKVDEFTLKLTRSKFARVCIEIDLSKPICRGFWVGDDTHRVFVVVLYERLPTFCYSCGIIGHGTNSCSHSTTTGENRTSPPPRFPRGSAVSSVRTEDVVEGMEMDSIANNLQGAVNPVDSTPDSEFGSWMLVSRRRGRARGRGASHRSDSVSVGTAAEENSAHSLPRGVPSQEASLLMQTLAPCESRQPGIASLPDTSSVPNVALINSSLTRSGSPPPIIHSSILNTTKLVGSPSENLHAMAVDRVITALDDGNLDDSDQEDEDSDDSEDAMSDEDDGPDDSMTLVQYQEEVRKETLARKSSHVMGSSLKKGRTDNGNSSS
ncbi:uncharacterized protein LOC120282820 [Dioscorea cayenensis subsp. rotundata]|uniref:Uncharacterized protein LOC120282820 n=1 Tax=Dioscorea cayennensis subsp. rotundata TaxID=55577 RepID=A0AB40D004_DIOCR|nr:uncharacterized protein LOC120282820 [Dioscorea cayenensis subsp. rotundata]